MPRLRPATVILLPALALCAAGLIGLIVRWLERAPDPVAPSDAIVVLGGDHPARILSAVDLFQAELAPEIWITGDVPPPGHEVSMAEAARHVAYTRGVPYDKQVLLPTTSTWEDGEQIRIYAAERNAKHLIILTSWYHSRRAMCVINHHLADLDVEVAYTPSSQTWPPSERWWRSRAGWRGVGREIAAFPFYWVWYRLPPWTC